MVDGKQLNACFASPVEYSEDAVIKNQFRERAVMAVQEFLRDARNVPSKGKAEALAIWPVPLSTDGVLQPLDAFEIED